MVHLEDNHAIRTFLTACHPILNPKGYLLLQIINYDRVLAKDVKGLPTIKNVEANVEMERHYTYLPDKHKVDFKTILKADGVELENHEMLHPIQSTELVALLEKAGFSEIELYSSFNKEKYDPMESVPLIIVCRA